ncbi:MAG: PRC-barrel domain-containing protein [Chloroflexota bacterium]|nr:PRC-barrel domain-containing protein [Chloroflexota bacterium]
MDTKKVDRARPGSMFMLSLLIVFGLVLGGCGVPNQPEVVVVPDAADTPAVPVATDTPVVADPVTDTTTMTDAASPGVAGDTVVLPGGGIVDAEDVFVTATSLLGYNWQNLNGDVSGELEDLLIDLNTGRVLFATLEYGGVLEIGDTKLPVPLSAFVWGPEGQLILNIEEERLQDFPSVGDDWPDFADATWDDDVNGYWRDLGVDSGFDFTEATDRVGWVSNLVGYPVGDVGLGVGNVSDMWIDLGQNYVRYVVLGYGAGTLANRPVAVPFSAFDMAAFGDQFVFAPGVDATVLEDAPSFAEDVTGVVPLNPDFDDDLESYWAERGYIVQP